MREVRRPCSSKNNTHTLCLIRFSPFSSSDLSLVPVSISPVPSASFFLQISFFFAPIQISIFQAPIFAPISPAQLVALLAVLLFFFFLTKPIPLKLVSTKFELICLKTFLRKQTQTTVSN